MPTWARRIVDELRYRVTGRRIITIVGVLDADGARQLSEMLARRGS